MKLLRIAALALMIAAAAVPALNAADRWGSEVERALVFNPGDYDSKFYRIPGLAVANNGDVIAVADKRIESNGDLPGKIDVVCRRSTDGGRTWSEYITVAEHNEDGGYGDPAIVVDRKSGDILVISSHGAGLWGKEPANIVVSRSRDNGLTWEAPVDITKQLYNDKKSPLKNIEGAFASSGAALQTRSGRLMFVLVTREKDVKPIKFKCYAIYSDDGGKNWKVSKTPGTVDGDESKVVELADGTILMSIRNRYRQKRMFSRSTDGGKTWSEMQPADDINDPACNGDIIAVPAPDGNGELLLQSLPGSPTDRRDVTIYVSKDGGKTWPIKRNVAHCPSAYSSLTLLPDGYIGILTEEDAHFAGPNHGGGYRLWYTRMPLDYILEGDN